MASKNRQLSVSETIQNTLDALSKRVTSAGKDVKAAICLNIIYVCAIVPGSGEEKDAIIEDSIQRAIASCHSQLLKTLGPSTNGVSSSLFEDRQTDLRPNDSMPPSVPISEAGPSQELSFLPVANWTVCTDDKWLCKG